MLYNNLVHWDIFILLLHKNIQKLDKEISCENEEDNCLQSSWKRRVP